MPRREREETQPEEEEQEIKQEVKLEYDIPMPFNDASSSSSSTSSSIVDSKFVYLQHLDLSELEEETKAILLENKIGFQSLLKADKAELNELGIVFGDRVSLLGFAEDCRKNGNVVPPPPANKKAATDGFVVKLIQAFDPSISQSSLKTVFRHLRFASTEFWMLSDNDFLAILRDDEDDDDDDGSDEAIKISNAQQYLMNEEHWDEIRTVVDFKSVCCFFSGKNYEAQLLDSYRDSNFVSQLSRVSPKKSETVKIHCMILMNFASKSDEGQKLLGRQEVVDSLVSSSRYITSAEAVKWWSLSICSITVRNESNQKLFGCSSILDSFVTVRKYVTSSEAAQWWSTAISNITNLESNEKLFGCQTVVDSFVSISKYATTAGAVRAWIDAINSITCSNDVEVYRVFSSSVEFNAAFFSLRQELEQMREDEVSREAKEQFVKVEESLL